MDSFIVSGTPTNASSYTSAVPTDTADFLASWPVWTSDNPLQASLNQSGGVLANGTDIPDPYDIVILTYVEPGLAPNFTVVNAYDWEGGRGARCDFWKSIGSIVPEKRK